MIYYFQRLVILYKNVTILFKTYEICFIWVQVETKAACCLLQAMQLRFGLSKFIYEKC